MVLYHCACVHACINVVAMTTHRMYIQLLEMDTLDEMENRVRANEEFAQFLR